MVEISIVDHDQEIEKILNMAINDTEWFNQHYSELIGKFDGRFIAIKNGQVVADDKDVTHLFEELRSQGHDLATTFVKYVSKVQYIL